MNDSLLMLAAARQGDLTRAAVPVRHVLATTAPGLSGAWWRRQSAGFAAGLVAATAPVR